MKKLLYILLPAFGLLAVAICTVWVFNSDIEFKESELEICAYYEPKTFSSVEEMSSFFAEGGKHRALSFDPAEVTSLVVPNVEAFREKLNAELVGISSRGVYVNFNFSIKDVDLEALAEEYEIEKVLPDWKNMTEEEAEERLNELQENKEIDYEQLRMYATSFSFTTRVPEDGDEVVSNFREMNPVGTWEKDPNVTMYPAPYFNMKHPPSYMLHWSDNGRYMQVAIPAQLLDAFWEAYPELFEIKKFR